MNRQTIRIYIAGLDGNDGCFQVENYVIFWTITGSQENQQKREEKFFEESRSTAVEMGFPETSDTSEIRDNRGEAIKFFNIFKKQPLVKRGAYHVRGIGKTGQIFVDEEELSLDDSLSFVNHSSDGFGWGYPGSAPAQAALAILLVILPSDVALNSHMMFKYFVIQNLPMDKDFSIELIVQSDSITTMMNDRVLNTTKLVK
jgi:hypothetical protein